MLVLALDTATTDLVVGVADVDTAAGTCRVLAESVEATRAHNERLVPTVNAVLADAGVAYADLGAVVVGCGPGPFTGLRVGMASASAFAQALGIPAYGVVTHDAVAADLASTDAATCLVVTDARRREVYWAHYEGGERVAGPAVCAPADVPVAHAGVVSVPEPLRAQLAVDTELDAELVTYAAPRTAGLVAAADFSAAPAPLTPHYLRRPDAVPPKAAPKSPALP